MYSPACSIQEIQRLAPAHLIHPEFYESADEVDVPIRIQPNLCYPKPQLFYKLIVLVKHEYSPFILTLQHF